MVRWMEQVAYLRQTKDVGPWRSQWTGAMGRRVPVVGPGRPCSAHACSCVTGDHLATSVWCGSACCRRGSRLAAAPSSFPRNESGRRYVSAWGCCRLILRQRDSALGAHEWVGVAGGEFGRPVARVVTQALPLAARDAEVDGDPPRLDADEVVGGVGETARAQRGDGAGVDEQHARDRPDVRDVAVAGEDEVDLALAE